MVRQWLSGLKLRPSSSRASQLRRRRTGHERRVWVLEGLEGRVLLWTPIYTVDLTTDNGPTSAGSGSGNTGDLRYAINQANADSNPDGSIIEFDPTVFATAQTITLSSSLGTLNLAETAGPEDIDGLGASIVTVSGGSKVGVFSVASNVTATLSGLTISDGATSTNGAGVLNSGTLTISDSTLTGNSAATMGGAIANLGAATITGSVLNKNTAAIGGGIENNSGTLTVSGSLIAQNTAQTNGGGIEDDGGTLTMSASAVEANLATNDGGGVNITAGTVPVTITDSTVAYNIAGDGGGIANPVTLSITNSTFTGNTATTAGGGIDNTGTVMADNVTIANNDVGSSGTGGGLEAAGGTATLENTIVAANSAGSGTSATASDIALSGGGAVSSSSAYNLIGTGGSGGLTGGTNGNQVNVANADLGTLADNGGPTLTVALLPGSPAIGKGFAVSGITTDQRGLIRGRTVDIGAFQTSLVVESAAGTLDTTPAAGTLTLPDAVSLADQFAGTAISFDTNAFSTPQTITLSNGTLDLSNTTLSTSITGPHAGVTVSGGGGVQVFSVASGVTATLSGLTISGGSATSGGGIGNAGTLTLTDSTLTHNTASNTGGGIDNSAGTLTITNSTIAGNSAASGGGGISNDSTATLTIISSTIADNTATSGGGLYVDGGSAFLYDTIVALNTAGGTTASDISLNGGVVSLSSAFNLIGTGGSGGLTQGSNHNQVGVANPVLGSLASNGGSTQTIAVLPGSPAIGTGSSTISGITIPTTDQRGVTRPAASVDIGAFQDQGFTITVVSGDSPQSAYVNTPFPHPLTVIVTSASGDPVQGGIINFTPPVTGASAALSADSATIGANGEAQVTATANGQAGSYTVTAAALGTPSPVSFSLTNVAVVIPITVASVTGVAVVWGSQIASLVVPSSSGGLLLPPGRHTDIPWLGINVLQITLSQPESLNTSNITLRSARGIKYQAVGVSNNGTSYVVFLSRAMTASDRITLTIAGAGLTTFNGQLNILPGDFNDNGVVNRQDYFDVRAEKLGLGPASSITFADINGDGVVNTRDLNLVRQRFGLKLPRQTTATRRKAVETRTRVAPAVRIVRDHPGAFRRKSRFAR